jgi:hypothetical protein
MSSLDDETVNLSELEEIKVLYILKKELITRIRRKIGHCKKNKLNYNFFEFYLNIH